MAFLSGQDGTRSRKLLIGICTALAVVLAILLVVLGLLSNYEKNILSNVYTELMVEAGTTMIQPDDLLIEIDHKYPVTIIENITEAQMRVPGNYTIRFSWRDREFSTTLRVVDTVKPTGTVQDMSAMGPVPAPRDFLTAIDDITEVTVTYKQEPDMTIAGTRPVTLVLTDTSGNYTELTANITVVVDNTAPVISGLKNLTVYLGQAAAYRAGVTVTDDLDPAPTLSVDNSSVNLSKVGKYIVVYTATDISGNTTRKEITVDVREKLANIVEIETVNAAADRVLSGIITPEMTQRQQVEAIYHWARTKCSYANHSDKTDYLQGAYQMLTTHSGDCFNYYAVTRLMFDRLGIRNIDVRKVKNYTRDSDHYWSMVSLDDGKTWYHFDATPRVGSGDDFCLVTDAFLDAYSNQNNKCHNRDKSLYPATPES